MSELVLFLVPISVVQYIPTFFFGSLLILFGVEITLDWLIYSYRKARSKYTIAHVKGTLDTEALLMRVAMSSLYNAALEPVTSKKCFHARM